MLPELSHKDADIKSVAEKALQDEGLLSQLLDGLTSRKETLRYNCFKVLMLLSQEHGAVLYPRWDYFVELLGSDNSYWRLRGLQIIANLTRVDTDSKFEKVFDRYYGLLSDEGTIVAAYVAANSGKIAQAKPHLQGQITHRLLNMDRVYRGKQIDLIKGHAVEAFAEYYVKSPDRDRIIEFVRAQLKSNSPRTRKQAQTFLHRMGEV
jgi:hypothetical protein